VSRKPHTFPRAQETPEPSTRARLTHPVRHCARHVVKLRAPRPFASSSPPGAGRREPTHNNQLAVTRMKVDRIMLFQILIQFFCQIRNGADNIRIPIVFRCQRLYGFLPERIGIGYCTAFDFLSCSALSSPQAVKKRIFIYVYVSGRKTVRLPSRPISLSPSHSSSRLGVSPSPR
jgi:hypothetical protein